MTIEEIKEWREQDGVVGLKEYGLTIIDTLLAEVEILNTIQESMRGHIAVIIAESVKRKDKLAVATEALNQIANHFLELPTDQRIAMIMRGRGRIEDAYQYIARTALERMKG